MSDRAAMETVEETPPPNDKPPPPKPTRIGTVGVYVLVPDEHENIAVLSHRRNTRARPRAR
eukprot:3964182-Pyramimonas_sp.AAC.1